MKERFMQQAQNPADVAKKKINFSPNIAKIAGEAISKKGYVSAIDLLLGIGWLTNEKVTDWKMGRVSYLERIINANLNKISKTMKEFRAWAVHSNLKPSITVYKHKSCSLRFSKSGNPNIEKAYSTHFVLQKPKKEEINQQTFFEF